MDALALAVAGDVERRFAGGVEALAALGLAQLLGAEGVAADRPCGLAHRAGDRERGDERALVLRAPAVGVGAARYRIEIEDVGDAGKSLVAGHAGRAALVADHGDGRDGKDGRGVEL